MSIVNVEALKQNGCELWWNGSYGAANAPKSITANGNVTQVLPFAGAGIGMFDGNGDYLAIPDSDDWYFGTNDFTIEFWYCPTILPTSTNGSLFEIRTTEYISPLVIMHDNYSSNVNKYAVMFSWDWTANRAMKSTTLASVGRWDHVALVRQGSTFKLYVNGIAESTYNSSNHIGNSGDPLYIGGVPFRATASINGMLCDYRISKNIARYTANFTPPKRQLESDSNTKLLIHFNRNDTTFIDSSSSAHTITTYGNAKQLCSPCGSGVAYFDGTGDYLTTPDLDAWSMFGTSDNFTIEGNVYYTSVAANRPLCGQYADANNYWNLTWTTSNTITLTGVSGGTTNFSYSCSFTPSALTHYHIAVVKSGSTCYMFVDGVAKTVTVTQAFQNTTNIASTLDIGRYATTPTYHYGYVSEFRISNMARYTTSFAPSTTPFQPDPYTKLLLHMDGTGQAFYDSSDPPGDNGFPILPAGVSITPTGTFTSVKGKDGRNYWKFDGSTNYLTISDHDVWSMFLNGFTISAWVKFDSVAANKIIIGQYTDANNQWYLQWTTGNVIQLYGITSSTARFDFSCPLTAVANTWYHIVVERSGSSCIMYINGVAQTVTQTTEFSTTATNIAAALSIGNINTGYQTGNIKDLQIFTEALTADQIGALYQETFIY